MEGHVFISYSQPDRECAFEMVGRLEARGIRCWIAPRDITPASDWAAEIIDAISSARAMILVLSASSNDSPQVRREVERAVHKQLIILPFRIEDVRPSKSLFLSTQHWMDAFPPPREPYYARLCSYLKMPAAPSTGDGHAEVVVEAPVQAPAVNSHDFDPGATRRIEALLADYIGPLAKHLVKRAAERAQNLDSSRVWRPSSMRRPIDAHSCKRAGKSGEKNPENNQIISLYIN